MVWRIFGLTHWGKAAAEKALLRALLAGAVLKAHRTMDGDKIHQLHRQGKRPTVVEPAIVRRVERKKLIQSNMKFPAATYLLTEQGAVEARAASAPFIKRPQKQPAS